MAQQLFFSRDSQMFLEIGTSVWKIPVLEGFSFSQATNTSEVTLAEMESTGGVSRRGRRAFNDSLAPVDFSFSTYIRPFKAAVSPSAAGSADAAAEVHAVEEALWALFSGPADYSASDDRFGGDPAATPNVNQINPGTTVSTIRFTESNVSALGPDDGANLYFELGDASKICYKLAKVALSEASIDFDIDGVAQINWTGFAESIENVAKDLSLASATSSSVTVTISDTGSLNSIDVADIDRRIAGTAAAGLLADQYVAARTSATVFSLSTSDSIAATDANAAATVLTLLGPRATIYEGTTATNNFIRNRLTKVFITVNDDPVNALEASYTLTLTGGNITLSNNITYLTPEELGIVNIPIGHVTGGRTFGGSMTCYLTEETSGSSAVSASRDFFEDLISENQRKEVTNDFKLTFLIGGGADETDGGLADPGLQVSFSHCHVAIPTHAVEDIITLETTFMALPSTIDLADEVTMKYKGPTPA
jgi:hypothetical protein